MAATQGFCHIHLFVTDIQRSVRFYSQGLGMREAFRDGPEFIFLNTPGTNDVIALHETDREGARPGESGGVWHFGFQVDPREFEALLRQVIEAGGRLIERGERGHGRPFAGVYDPDGYAVELYTAQEDS